jgi:FKBP-type peptidyl-prolyl cis-trans isomerase 2
MVLAPRDKRFKCKSAGFKSCTKRIFKNKKKNFMTQVKENNTVKVHYTGKLADGEIFDSSEGKEPLAFTLGQGSLIPGFEKGLIDMKLNEKKTITIPADEAYGDPREDLLIEVPKSELPQEMDPEVGMGLVSRTPEGQEINLLVVEVKEDTVVLDGNHPLAGKELIFDLEVVEITI